jgi:hypothetical protein
MTLLPYLNWPIVFQKFNGPSLKVFSLGFTMEDAISLLLIGKNPE